MTNYEERLNGLIAGQVDEFIARQLKDEYGAYNGDPPIGAADGTGRFGQLMNLEPRYKSSELKSGDSKLYLTP